MNTQVHVEDNISEVLDINDFSNPGDEYDYVPKLKIFLHTLGSQLSLRLLYRNLGMTFGVNQ